VHRPETPLPMPVLARRLVLGIGALLAAVVVLGLTRRQPLEALSEKFVEHFGLLGIFVGIAVWDAMPLTTHEPFLFFGYSGGLGFWPVAMTASAGSVTAGFVGYAIGRLLGSWDRFHRLLIRYRIAPFLNQYGAVAIAIAAATPVPFAITTWGAGASRISLRQLAIGSLFRIPKVIVYLAVIVLGWRLAA